MVIELESQRIMKEEIEDFLVSRNYPKDCFYWDDTNQCWVVGAFIVGKTLKEAHQMIPRIL